MQPDCKREQGGHPQCWRLQLPTNPHVVRNWASGSLGILRRKCSQVPNTTLPLILLWYAQIPVVQDLPVGDNLQDHTYTIVGPFPKTPSLNPDRDITPQAAASFLVDGSGEFFEKHFNALAHLTGNLCRSPGSPCWTGRLSLLPVPCRQSPLPRPTDNPIRSLSLSRYPPRHQPLLGPESNPPEGVVGRLLWAGCQDAGSLAGTTKICGKP